MPISKKALIRFFIINLVWIFKFIITDDSLFIYLFMRYVLKVEDAKESKVPWLQQMHSWVDLLKKMRQQMIQLAHQIR